MTETFLLWGKCACGVTQILAMVGAFMGVALICGANTPPRAPAVARAGAWMLAVSVLLLVALPWWPVWDAWIEMARRP